MRPAEVDLLIGDADQGAGPARLEAHGRRSTTSCAMMVDNDLAQQQAVAGLMTVGARHRGHRAGRQLPRRAAPRRGRRGARAGALERPRRRPGCPTAWSLHEGDLTDPDARCAAASLRRGARRASTTWPASARWPTPGSDPGLTTRRSRGRRAGPDGGRAPPAGATGPAGAVPAGRQRRDLRRRRPCRRRTSARPIRPVNPYGAAKAFATTSPAVYRQRGLHTVDLHPLQPRVAPPPAHLRHPQDHRAARPRSPRGRPTG